MIISAKLLKFNSIYFFGSTMNKNLFFILFALSNLNLLGQIYPVAYINNDIKDSLEINDVIMKWDDEIRGINLTSDKDFTFSKRPSISCFSWKDYNGNWEIKNDTLIFTEKLTIIENDAYYSFSEDSDEDYKIKFKSYKFNKLNDKQIEISFIYDYDSKLKDFKTDRLLDENFFLKIPYNEIPNRSELAAIRYSYVLKTGDLRRGYITENKIVNRKGQILKNKIEVTFVESPRKEEIFRTTKGILNKNSLKIISSKKSKSNLPDYTDNLFFKDIYFKN